MQIHMFRMDCFHYYNNASKIIMLKESNFYLDTLQQTFLRITTWPWFHLMRKKTF